MNRLNERLQSALDLFLNGCRIWAEIQSNQNFLDQMGRIKAEFERISKENHDEETVALLETLIFHVLSELDSAIKNAGLKGLNIEGTRH